MVKDLVLRAAFGLLVASAACATTVSDVRRLDRKGDVDGLVDAWRGRPAASVMPALVEALAHHHEDARAKRIVLEAARRHRREPVRQRAVAGLGGVPGPEATAVLLDALADPFPTVRGQARTSLQGRMGLAVGAVSTAARAHASPLVRADALRLLVSAAAAEAGAKKGVVEVLTDRALRDDDPGVRAAAANGLGTLNVVGARSLLTRLSRTDDDTTVRQEASAALSKLDAPTPDERVIIAVLPIKNATGDPSLNRFGGQIADYLMAQMSTATAYEVVDSARRDAAIEELKKLGSELYDGDRPNAPELGRFALADQLAYGVLHKTGLVYTLVLHRMSVSTLKIVAGSSATVRGYRAGLDRMKVDVASRFVARMR